MTITQGSIRLQDMRFYAYHGVMEQERRVGGEYLVSLQVEADLSGLYEVVRRVMAEPSQLLEHVAGRIGQCVLEEFPQITALTVSVTKCNPPMGADCKGASVELRIEN